MSILVIDVGTSGLRVSVVGPDARIAHEAYRECLPDSPMPGLVEFDGNRIASMVTDLAEQVMAASQQTISAVAITNQRASTLLWDRASGEPVAPGLGWQDLRTAGDCQALAAEGLRLAPNLSATKVAHLLDMVDPDRSRDLCFGTIDSWLAWVLSGGASHVTDRTNAALTGLLRPDGTDWNAEILERLNIPRSCLPALVATSGPIATATTLSVSAPICALVGDQQASMLGQGIVAPPAAKITFGTGGMLDLVTDETAPAEASRGRAGTYPIVAFERRGEIRWGREAVMLSAGTNVEWLRDDMGLIDDVADSSALASSCEDSGGVVYVPALLGLGTPHWDYGARGTLLGLTRGTGRAEVVRAVLEGVAQRGADLVEAAEADTDRDIPVVRIDGGMSRNEFFVQALADASGRPVEVSPEREATTLGAAFAAGLEVGHWDSTDDVAETWSPERRVEPDGPDRREEFRRATERATRWIPDLSDLDF